MGVADFIEDLIRRRVAEGNRPVTPLPLIQEQTRQSLPSDQYQFAKPEEPPGPIARAFRDSTFGKFVGEAAPYLNMIGAPYGMGLSRANIRLPPMSTPGAMPQSLAPETIASAPTKPSYSTYENADAARRARAPGERPPQITAEEVLRRMGGSPGPPSNVQRNQTGGANYVEPPPINQPSRYDWAHGLTTQQRQVIQNRIDAGYPPPASPAELGRQLGVHANLGPLRPGEQWNPNVQSSARQVTLPPDANAPLGAPSLAQQQREAKQENLRLLLGDSSFPLAERQRALQRARERGFEPPEPYTQPAGPQRPSSEEIAAQEAARLREAQSRMPDWQRYQQGGLPNRTGLGQFSEAPRPRTAAETAAALRQEQSDASSQSLMNRLSTTREQKRRLLPSEMEFDPIKVRGRGADEERWEIEFKPGGKYEGSITGYANKRDKTFQISSSGISSEFQSTGAGQEGYRRLFEKARELGYTIKSDSTQSDYSYRLYRDVFPRMGWKATRAASYRHNPNAMYPHTSRDANWTMVSQPPEPLDLPPMSLRDRMLLRGVGDIDSAPLGAPPSLREFIRRRRGEE